MRYFRVLPAILFGLLLSGCASVPGISSSGQSSALQNDLDLFLQWFPGEYDNYEQHWQDKLDEVEQVHEHIHHIFFPVSMPGVGEHTFFVQQYMDGDPANIYRMRLYNLSLDDNEAAIRLDIFTFKDEERFSSSHLNPQVLTGLTRDDFIERPGCEVYWKNTGEYFHGYMKEDACQVVSRRSGKTIIITDDLRLTPDEIWIRDEAFYADGTRVFGNRAGIHHKNRKVQYYSGWAGVSTTGQAVVPDDGNWQASPVGPEFIGDLDVFGRFVIHNEGQVVPIVDEDGNQSGYSVRLAKLTYQNTTLPILTLKIIEDATARTLAYSWSETGSERIGINTRWAQSGLTLQSGSPSWGFPVAE